jgi:hypothetical protein
MNNPRFLTVFAVLIALLLVGVNFAATSSKNTGLVAVPARAGAVVGTSQNSDEFIWRLFSKFAAPIGVSQPATVQFETWASDEDTFSYTPHWPTPNEPKKFQASVLGAATATQHDSIDVPCATPGNAAVGGFPTAGTPTPCIAEEVRRNRVQYDYIVSNNLNTQVGLASAFAKGFKVTMPTSAIAVKGDWVPVPTLLQWLPQLGSVAKVKQLYYIAISNSLEYALVSLHVSSRQNPNWVWATFEHQMNPGRCDSMGCYDSFGTKVPVVLPNNAAINTQYGACPKTPALKAIMEKAKLSRVWEHYCLKSSQVDYTDADGTPNVLGNSVTERIVGNGTISASSCIACHVYASFGSTGATTAGAAAMLPYNPTGKPIAAVLAGSSQFDFMWGVLLAPKPPK